MTSNQLVEAALRMIVPAPPMEARDSLRTALRLAIKPALERVGDRVAKDESRRHLLRKELGTVEVEDGIADLSDLLIGTQPLLLSDIRRADIRTEGGVKLQMLADRGSLDGELSSEFQYGAVEGETLFTDAEDGDLTVTANYIELEVGELKAQLIPMLLEEMVGAFAQPKAA